MNNKFPNNKKLKEQLINYFDIIKNINTNKLLKYNIKTIDISINWGLYFKKLYKISNEKQIKLIIKIIKSDILLIDENNNLNNNNILFYIKNGKYAMLKTILLSKYLKPNLYDHIINLYKQDNNIKKYLKNDLIKRNNNLKLIKNENIKTKIHKNSLYLYNLFKNLKNNDKKINKLKNNIINIIKNKLEDNNNDIIQILCELIYLLNENNLYENNIIKWCCIIINKNLNNKISIENNLKNIDIIKICNKSLNFSIMIINYYLNNNKTLYNKILIKKISKELSNFNLLFLKIKNEKD